MPAQKARESLDDAREILKRIRQRVRQHFGSYARRLDEIILSGSDHASVAALKLLLEYSTGGPPSHATATDIQADRAPNTDEYKEWRQYELDRFKAWQQANTELAPIDPTLTESPGQVVLDIRRDGVGA